MVPAVLPANPHVRATTNAGASYRQTVLTALQEVEDNLILRQLAARGNGPAARTSPAPAALWTLRRTSTRPDGQLPERGDRADYRVVSSAVCWMCAIGGWRR